MQDCNRGNSRHLTISRTRDPHRSPGLIRGINSNPSSRPPQPRISGAPNTTLRAIGDSDHHRYGFQPPAYRAIAHSRVGHILPSSSIPEAPENCGPGPQEPQPPTFLRHPTRTATCPSDRNTPRSTPILGPFGYLVKLSISCPT